MRRITDQTVAGKLAAYLHHQLSLDELVAWAEQAMLDGEFEDENFEAIRDIVSWLGVADVKAFGMTWEDCEEFLSRLGYVVKIEVVAERERARP